MAAVYTVHASSIWLFNCLYFPNVTLKTYEMLVWIPPLSTTGGISPLVGKKYINKFHFLLSFQLKKSEKNSEVGGWVKAELGFYFLGEVFFFFFCFYVSNCFQNN